MAYSTQAIPNRDWVLKFNTIKFSTINHFIIRRVKGEKNKTDQYRIYYTMCITYWTESVVLIFKTRYF